MPIAINLYININICYLLIIKHFFSAEYSAKMDCTAYSGSSVSGSPNKFLVDDG